MTKIAECGRCGRRLVIHAKGMCEHCYKQRFRNPNAKLRPDLQQIKSIEPVEIIAEQPKEPKPTPRVDPPAEAFSRRDLVIMRARAALAVESAARRLSQDMLFGAVVT